VDFGEKIDLIRTIHKKKFKALFKILGEKPHIIEKLISESKN